MTKIEAMCLTVIRIDGPISSKEVADHLGVDREVVRLAITALAGACLIGLESISCWDVTQKGRLAFSKLHRNRPKRVDVIAKLKARCGWKA